MKDFWAEEQQNQRKGKLKKLAILITFIIIVIAFLVLIAVYMLNMEFRRWCDDNILIKEVQEEDAKTIELDSNENAKVYAYDKYICIFRKKTLEFYNKSGNKIDALEIDINNPVFVSAGDYIAISEEQGQKFYLICGREKLYENSIEGTINQINVNEGGYISIVLSNASYKSVVEIYDKSGKEVFKTNLVTSRVADVSISKDNKYLAIAEIDISGILIKSSIQIVSMELAQTNPKEAILYKYEAPTDKLIINIEYQDKGNLICLYNDAIEMLKDNQSTKIVDLNTQKASFMTINLNNRIAILEEISTGEYTSDTDVKIMNPVSLKQREYIGNDVAKSIYTYENKIAINFGAELHIINTNGILLKKYISTTEINDVVISKDLVGVIYRDKIQIINI